MKTNKDKISLEPVAADLRRTISINPWTILDILPDALPVLDAAGVICYVNAAWQECFQSRLWAAYHHRPGHRFLDQYGPIFAAGGVPTQELSTGLQHILEGSEPEFHFDYHFGEQNAMIPTLPTTRWFTVTMMPYETGCEYGVLVQQREVTTVAPEPPTIAAHYVSDELLHDVLDSLTERIVVVDRGGTIIAINAAWERFARDSGVDDPQRVGVGVNYLDVCRQATGPFSEQALDACTGIQAVLDRIVPQFTLEYPCPTHGIAYWYMMYVAPLITTSAGAVILHVDITERKRAQEEILRLERTLLETQKLESLGRMAGGIAHDFNNLLMVILGNASLALTDLLPESPVYTSVSRIELAARHAADLTQQMLAFAGKRHVVLQPLNLNTLITETIDLLPTFSSTSFHLQTSLVPQHLIIQADITQMRQLIVNLIRNAAEAMDADTGVINLTTGIRFVTDHDRQQFHVGSNILSGTCAYLEIADTGSGIDATQLPHIFDPFFTTKFTGKGLGLAVVLGVVQSHGGALQVQSTLGHGTTFTVLLPLMPDKNHDLQEPGDDRHDVTEATICSAERHSFMPTLSAAGMVLIIDDEPDVRSVTARMLQREGFSVLTAADGQLGLKLFRQHAHAIRCVWLDYTMPGLSGEQTLRAIHALRPDVPVVLMSGYTQQQASHHCSDLSLAGFLQKPFSISDVQAMVQRVINPGSEP